MSPHGDIKKLRHKLSDYLKKNPSQKSDKNVQGKLHNLNKATKIPDSNTGFSNGDSKPNPVARVCDSVRKWNLKFDGEKGAVAFLERLDELKTSYAISDDEMLSALPELFRGKAILWFRINKVEWSGYNDFIEAFRSNYLPPDFKSSLGEEIRARTQGADECIRDFIIALRTLMRRHGGISMGKQLELVYKNLRPEYKTYIRRGDFETITELMQLGNEYELLCKEAKVFRPPRVAQAYSTDTAYQGKPRTEVRNITTPVGSAEPQPLSHGTRTAPPPSRSNAKAAAATPSSRCWNCDDTSHTHRSCKMPRNVFCYRCGYKGKTVSSCPNCSGNYRRTR